MRGSLLVSVFISIGVILAIAFVYSHNNQVTESLTQNQLNTKQVKSLSSSHTTNQFDELPVPILNLTLTNEYKDIFTLYPFTYIAQVMKETTYSVQPSIDYEDAVYLWTIDGSVYSGQQVQHTFTTIGPKDIVVKMIYNADNSEVSATFTVMAKYVRREIRSLTNEDREAFLSAMQVLFYTPTKEGKKIYGEKFRGVDHFISEHLHGSARKTCDHWHDGAGIMTHHTSITLEFENSLRVVDPTVSMPYWDYTIDEYIYGVDWEDSVIFSDDWFGDASPDNDEHIITEGRFAYLPIIKDSNGSYPITNPHGLLRSPWNANPVAYVTRHDKVLRQRAYKHLPTCRSFYEAFQEDWIGELNNALNGYLHGPVHIMIGGHINKYHDDREINKYTGATISSVLLISKNLWRLGYARCPESCDGLIEKECQCSCPEHLRQNKTAYEILVQEDQMKYISQVSMRKITYDLETGQYGIDGLTHPQAQEIFEDLFETICSFGYPGEMYTSASPADPTFWLIHPTAERFLQLRRFASYYGNSTLNETWGYEHSSITPSDFQKVCSWDGVGDNDLPRCVYGNCYGHAAHDLIPQTDLIPGRSTFTNQEFYDFMDPRNQDIPYVYDNFKAEHCSAQGYTFEY